MSSPDRGVRVEVIREAARLAVDATSLRAVARAVGVSPMGLKNFIDGRNPYRATLRKLTIWYVGHGTEGELSEDVVRAAMSLMLRGLPASSAQAGTDTLLRAVEEMYHRAGMPPPEWVFTLRGEGGG